MTKITHERNFPDISDEEMVVKIEEIAEYFVNKMSFYAS
jgi:hypothetical protein